MNDITEHEFRCGLEPGHDGPHMTVAQEYSVGRPSRWWRWRDGDDIPETVDLFYCEELLPDPDPKAVEGEVICCHLYAGHAGDHYGADLETPVPGWRTPNPPWKLIEVQS